MIVFALLCVDKIEENGRKAKEGGFQVSGVRFQVMSDRQQAIRLILTSADRLWNEQFVFLNGGKVRGQAVETVMCNVRSGTNTGFEK